MLRTNRDKLVMISVQGCISSPIFSDIGKVDMDFLIELGQSRIPFAIIFTKGDKNGPNALQAQVDRMKAQILELWEELPPTFISSSETGLGREEILDYIESVLKTLKNDNE